MMLCTCNANCNERIKGLEAENTRMMKALERLSRHSGRTVYEMEDIAIEALKPGMRER